MPRHAAALGLCALLFLLLPVGPAVQAGPDDDRPAEITRRELKELVKFFADDDMEGREGGTPAGHRAAERIAQEFGRAGLEPSGEAGSFFQPFSKPKGTKVLPTSALSVTSAKGKQATFRLDEQFAPMDLSAAGEVTGEAAFAGYGISAPELGYDDYAGLDVKGRVVVVLRHAPRWQDERKSPFAPQAVMARHGTFKAKMDAAVAHGAAALLVVNDPASHSSKSDDELRPPSGGAGGAIPVVHLTWIAGRKLGARIGIPLVRRQQAIDGKLEPGSEPCPGVTIHVKCDLEPDIRQMRNVVGILQPAAGEVTTGGGGPVFGNETILLGAHYDHVGMGHFGSLAKAGGKVHNGADDNASGTVSLIEMAGFLAANRSELRRRVLFVAFDGEELGLLGSKHYAGAPCVPMADTVAMINLDMVARSEKNRLFVGGTGTSPVWPAMLERVNASVGKFAMTCWPGGKAPSDHSAFYEAGVPVLFFFTGLHSDYHRPTDDWDTLNYPGHERLTQMAACVVLELAKLPERPQFTKCDAGGFTVGPYTGLAVEQRDDGVFVAHVAPKSPGSQAHFRIGDQIAEWNKAPIPSTNTYNDILSKAKPGDRVEVIVMRDGKRKRLKLKLGKT